MRVCLIVDSDSINKTYSKPSSLSCGSPSSLLFAQTVRFGILFSEAKRERAGLPCGSELGRRVGNTLRHAAVLLAESPQFRGRYAAGGLEFKLYHMVETSAQLKPAGLGAHWVAHGFRS